MKPVWLCVFALMATGFVGAQTPNTVPVYTSSSTFGDSPISISGGNVGIGTTSPTHRLTVLGDQHNDKSSVPSSLYLFDSVGYSATTPFPSQAANPDWSGVMLNQTLANGDSHHLAFSISTDNQAAPNYIKGRISTWRDGSGPVPDLEFATSNSTQMTILSTGNIGIGTTSPNARLEVNGSINLTAGSGASVTYPDGTAQSTAWTGVLSGGDYAESVNVSGVRGEYEPGDVLVIDPSAEGKFLKSSAPYSTAVTGIYSTRPGVVGRRQRTAREHMKDEVPMAMTGIVPTKVSTENGPIHPGDLLVTSSKSGYAMKGTNHRRMLGAVIGKAIGRLDSGVGVIEAVVTLQ
jgi:hypothetical protein